MLVSLFIAFVIVMAAAVVLASIRYLDGRSRAGMIAGLLVWLTYVGSIAYFGLVRNINLRPPGPAFLFGPLVILITLFVFQTRPSAGGKLGSAVPLWLLLGAQCFRVPVELFLHQLWQTGLIPKMLTFEGANVDIYIGASAPVIAWLATRKSFGRRLALLWNVLGLLALANVVARAVLTTPGPLNLIHAEVPDLMIGTFPYTFIPGFFVPLAVLLHVLALRALTSPAK
jgi:hypothetical protein